MIMIHIEEKLIGDQIRYVVVDDYGVTIEDAQGYGFKTKTKALKCYWYLYHCKNKNGIKDESQFGNRNDSQN